jgi:hypothetical protein
LLQAAMAKRIVSVFRNATRNLRFANGVSATIGTGTSAIGVGHGWDYQSVDQHQGCGNDE